VHGCFKLVLRLLGYAEVSSVRSLLEALDSPEALIDTQDLMCLRPRMCFVFFKVQDGLKDGPQETVLLPEP